MLKKTLMTGAALLVSAPLAFTALAQQTPQNTPNMPKSAPTATPNNSDTAKPMPNPAGTSSQSQDMNKSTPSTMPSTQSQDTTKPAATPTGTPQTANAPSTTRGDMMNKNAAISADGSMSANALIGANVRNSANEKIGAVDDVLIGKDGKVTGVIVGVGGFLGVGEHNVLLSWDKVQLREDDDHDGLVVATDATKDSLKSMPEYTSK